MPTSTIWPVGALAKEASLAVPRESLVITTRSESWPSKSVVAKVSKLAQVPLSQYGFRRLLFSHRPTKFIVVGHAMMPLGHLASVLHELTPLPLRVLANTKLGLSGRNGHCDGASIERRVSWSWLQYDSSCNGQNRCHGGQMEKNSASSECDLC